MKISSLVRSTLITTSVGLSLVFGCMGRANAATMFSFIIDGDTFTKPFNITNSSSGGELVTRFQLDLSPVNMVFDTVDGGLPGNGTNGVPFKPAGGSAVTTGLVTPVTVPDGSSLLDIKFTDFNAGETFSWDIDVDGKSGNPISVFGNNLIGALATIDFSDNTRLLGVLAAVNGKPEASAFTVTGRTTVPPTSVPEPASVLGLLAVGAFGAGSALKRKQKQNA